MKKTVVIFWLFVMIAGLCQTASAKSYKFDIKQTVAETMLVKKHKDHNNFKIIRVVAVDKNADKAIEKAMMCAMADAMFRGIQGFTNPTTQEVVPEMKPILKDGLEAYTNNKDFFDNFFKKGDFNQFIRRAMTDYPSGENNVKGKDGTRVVDVFILNHKALVDYLKAKGFSVNVGNKLSL